MNIVEQIDRVRFWTDRVLSARWNVNSHIIPAIDVAIDFFHKELSAQFEQSKIIRSELLPLVVPDLVLAVSSQYTISLPADFAYEVKLDLLINAARQYSTPKAQTERTKIDGNSFRKASDTDPVHFNDNRGILVQTGGTLPTFSYLTYIRNYKKPFWDTTVIAAGPSVLTIGQEYYVVTAAVHNAISYAAGSSFIAATTALTSGTVNHIQSCELGESIHEEVSKYASFVLLGTVEKYDKSLLLGKDFMKK